MISLVAESTPMLIQYRKTLTVSPHVSTPRKVKSKTNGVTIQEPSSLEQPKKRNVAGFLKTKVKQYTPKPKTMKPNKIIVNKEGVLVEIEDEDIDTEVPKQI